ncbi:hypothetical protein GCM10011613_15820 [Cellvibrio zantedeschiae]|uniref:Cytochrome b561 bacterial/Ni-hydrogenase domain-containing protein n=1 Tax=Cellvibrio zantedeschiae TaxID=1237077 RepID=A0ABQ3AYH9_9GAMM|nr:cytochrome b/b6 domain-containing protein [Cellvibrio zantedeschiae]GGY71779.1 hypothetical protein GCM10011613_15820 [Cellvibrio zantedeschiae]
MTDLNENSTTTTENKTTAKTIKVWDLPVRIFHWLLVLLFIAAYITNSLGTNYFQYHLWCGYALIVLVSFRIIWGLVGTYHARFSNFVRNPITTIKYAINTLRGTEKHYLGHNPLGAIMVIVLLLASLIQGVSGLFTNDEILNVGPLYAYVSDELSLKLTSLHRQLFYWILGAILLHIVAVLVHVFIKRDNIIKAMFTGKKAQQDHAVDQTPISSSRIWLAIIIVIILALVLAWIISHAPTAALSIEEY